MLSEKDNLGASVEPDLARGNRNALGILIS